jgi:hypothetical protein
MKKIIFIVAMFCMFKQTDAQQLTQSVNGRVIDAVTQVPLTGATVKVLETHPLKGTIADLEGLFSIPEVPVGRHNIEITFVGYEPVVVADVLVTTGKSSQIVVAMRESLINLKELVIMANQDKEKPLNEMASVSARGFTMEETRRYAGGFDDPARLASAFAGVTGNNISDNGVIVRGNAPKGIQWRIEGVESPNPNHFQGADVAGAGFFTLLSTHTMANSDFFTGAFPAEYGNALSGIFDINLRSGNPFARENTFQAGIIGIDFASEGPFKNGGKATYLFNYRYSTFGLIQPLLPDDASKLNYQDLSFKFYFPTRIGIIELWGVGGKDYSDSNKELQGDSTQWETYRDMSTIKFGFDVGTTGLTYKTNLGERAFFKTTFGASVNNSFYDEDVISPNNHIYDENTIEQDFFNLTGMAELNYKHSSRWNTRSGIIVTRMDNFIKIKSALERYQPQTIISEDNHAYNRYQAYFQSQHYLNSGWTLNLGAHSQYAELIDEHTIEPRLGLTWNHSNNSSLSFGYGLHSMLEEIKVYKVVDLNGTTLNDDLGFTKAHHLAFAWDKKISRNTRIKVEPYYQYLFDVPVIQDSTFSMLNFTQDWLFHGNLDPIGAGRNYGIDFTLERFMKNNFYYLVTGSVFKSEYRDGREEWHPTRFDRSYAFDLLGGKEWVINRNKNRLLGLNFRMNVMGGRRKSPIDMESSLAARKEIFDESRPFTERESPVQVLDLTLTWRTNRSKSSSEWALQIKNLLGSKTDFGHEYNYQTSQMERQNLAIIVPNITYKVEF